jgi:hypothetical protein
MTKILEQIRSEEMKHQSGDEVKQDDGEKEGRSDSESSGDDLNAEELNKLRNEVYTRQMQFGN